MLDLAAFVECPHCLKLSRRNVDIWGDRSREWVVQGNKIAESGFEFHAVCCLAVLFCSGFFQQGMFSLTRCVQDSKGVRVRGLPLLSPVRGEASR